MNKLAILTDTIDGVEIELNHCTYGDCYYVSVFKRKEGTTSTSVFSTEKKAHKAFKNSIK